MSCAWVPGSRRDPEDPAEYNFFLSCALYFRWFLRCFWASVSGCIEGCLIPAASVEYPQEGLIRNDVLFLHEARVSEKREANTACVVACKT